jgi:hypothetical protein
MTTLFKWIWIAVSRLTRRILAIEVGARGKKTLKRLWARLSHLKPFAVATDKWKGLPPNHSFLSPPANQGPYDHHRVC